MAKKNFENSELENQNDNENLNSDIVDNNITDKITEETDNSTQTKNNEKDLKKKGFFKKSKETEIETLNLQIEDIKIQKAEMHDKYLRLYSEFDNYRKRTQKEKLETIKTASEDIIKTILPVLDDFERALKSFNNIDSLENAKLGIELIYSKMQNILKQKGLAPIESIGKEFNTDYHEAITNIAANQEEQKGFIIDEIEKGYTLNDKIIRFAKVVVAN